MARIQVPPSDGSAPASSSSKNIFVAFFLWFTTGLFGSHHFYLGRDLQAFLWLSSWGGFGVGWLRDFFRLPAYVDWANKQPSALAHLQLDARQRPSLCSWRRLQHFLAMFFFGHYFGAIASTAFYPLVNDVQEPLAPMSCSFRRLGPSFNESIYAAQFYGNDNPEIFSPPANAGALFYLAHTCFAPQSILRILSSILRAIGTATGVWLVGNATLYFIVPYRRLIITAIVTQIFFLFSDNVRHTFNPRSAHAIMDYNADKSAWVAIFTIIAATQATRWADILTNDSAIVQPKAEAQPKVKESTAVRTANRSCCMRFWRLMLFGSLFGVLLLINALNTVHVQDVKLKVALRNAMDSPQFIRFSDAMKELFRHAYHNGWQSAWEELGQEFEKMDAGGTQRALHLLELDDGDTPKTLQNVTLSDIKRARNRLALKYHPDKLPPNTDEDTKTAAIDKFNEIQKACEVLESAIRRRNSREEDDSTQQTHTHSQSFRTTQQQQQQRQYSAQETRRADSSSSASASSNPSRTSRKTGSKSEL